MTQAERRQDSFAGLSPDDFFALVQASSYLSGSEQFCVLVQHNPLRNILHCADDARLRAVYTRAMAVLATPVSAQCFGCGTAFTLWMTLSDAMAAIQELTMDA
jgi:hypothetical protein